jgi:hypothetical protein
MDYLMPVYHFHLTFGERLTEDAEGATLPNLQAAQKYAQHAARELLAEAIRWGRRAPPDSIVVVDHQGREVLTAFIVDVLPEAIRKRIR